jgi:hypothetical protein
MWDESNDRLTFLHGQRFDYGRPTQRRDEAPPMAAPLSSETGLRLWQSLSAVRQGFAYGSPSQLRDRASPMLSHLAVRQGFAYGSPRGFWHDYLVCCDGGPASDRPRVRDTTLWCALRKVKRIFVVVVLATSVLLLAASKT